MILVTVCQIDWVIIMIHRLASVIHFRSVESLLASRRLVVIVVAFMVDF